MAQSTEKILFVVNPIAGGKDKNILWPFVRQAQSLHQFNSVMFETTGTNDTQELRHLLATHPFTKVIAVGGDGTVKLVAEQLIHQTIPLGIIPMGSANGLAKELGIPANPKEALRIALDNTTINIDTINIEGHGLCIHLSDLGLNATLIQNFEQNKRRGMWGYAQVLYRTLLQRNLFRIHLANDHLRLQRKVYMLMLANARKFGTGVVINPTGSIRDGFFEVIMIKGISLRRLPRLFYNNRTPSSDHEEVVAVTSIHIASNKPIHFQMDGEYKGQVKRLKARILPHSLRVLVPPGKQPE